MDLIWIYGALMVMLMVRSRDVAYRKYLEWL
jgi:hypothetical protein